MRFNVALCVALAVLLAAGAGYRILAARHVALDTSTPIPRGTLARVPLEIGDWRGQDVPMDERVVRRTDTDDHINRSYRRSGGTVFLFVGYGIRLRDLAPHRPEVCYPGAGWTLDGVRNVDLPLSDGGTLPCRILRFHRGGLEARSVVVLNYYIVNDESCPDVSLLRSKAWSGRRDGTLRYSAQVQITAPEDMGRFGAEALVRDFAAEAAPWIRKVLTDAVGGVVGAASAPQAVRPTRDGRAS